jgi:GNAT superfamily N-acetyltransferase
MEVVTITKENISLLENFIKENTFPLTFRYFNKRDISCVENHILTVLVKMDGKYVAYSHIDKEGDNYWFGICVIDNYRNKGIGKYLMQYIFTKDNFPIIKLTVDKENFSAIHLYEKFGFLIKEDKISYFLMMRSKKNILYILNHKTLTHFEVPILINQGYGVLINKTYKSLNVMNSVTSNEDNYFYDNFLNLTHQNIKILNEIDWFDNDQVLNNEILEILNHNFSAIIITLLTEKQLLLQLVRNFKGKIYYRFFGREAELKYSDCIRNEVKIEKKVKYIFSYDEIYNFDDRSVFHKENSFVVPLGICNNFITKYINIYEPKYNGICFICSKINACPYYTKIYNEFIRNFSELNYIILGKNNVTNNERIINGLSDNDFYKKMASSKLLYYHGKEPRHLHYHPIEAIIMGIPVIFHAESLLSKYLFNSLGKCSTLQEVKDKIKRILNDDRNFINDIITYQNRSIDLFTQERNRFIFNEVISDIQKL